MRNQATCQKAHEDSQKKNAHGIFYQTMAMSLHTNGVNFICYIWSQERQLWYESYNECNHEVRYLKTGFTNCNKLL